MSIYLHDIPLSDAKQRFDRALGEANLQGLLGKEEIPLDEAGIGRVLAEPVWAILSSPHYHASAMDGFAIRSISTAMASPSAPVTLICGKDATYLDTGDPLPEWADAVIPIEDIEPVDVKGRITTAIRNPYAIRIRASSPPWKDVRSLGEDIVATQLVLPQGHILRPVDLGATAACGHHSIVVAKKPRVAILPTGTELIPLGQPAKKGDIIEYNSIVLAAQVNSWGGVAKRHTIIPDDLDTIRRVVQEAARGTDLILLNAGSSAGSEDFSARVIESLGDVLVHGIAVRPGHPVIIGMIKKGEGPNSGYVPIIGVPGYPVSAALTCEIFIEPLLAMWTGRNRWEAEKIEATFTTKITSPPGDDDYVRVALGKVGDKILAAPISRGAGVITSLVQADGIVVVPRGSQGISSGEKVQVNLYTPVRAIERTILAMGSHDITLDLLAQFLATRSRRLSSANIGSLAGLMAIKNQQCHLAGSHLLDEETGEYNISYIHRYLPNTLIKVISLVGRQQGLIVQPGNPKKIEVLVDLSRTDVRFINRQRGAGTRVLLDYELKKAGLSPDAIRGYEQEEYTHLNVAAAVASNRADCGLGIAAAAYALEMAFVPLFEERYDLIIHGMYADDALLEPLFSLLSDAEFRSAVSALPGYDVSPMGSLVYENRV